MKKTILPVMTLLALTMAFTSCSKKNDTDTSTTTTTTTGTTATTSTTSTTATTSTTTTNPVPGENELAIDG